MEIQSEHMSEIFFNPSDHQCMGETENSVKEKPEPSAHRETKGATREAGAGAVAPRAEWQTNMPEALDPQHFIKLGTVP